MLLDADVATPPKSSFAGKLMVSIVVVLALLLGGGWYFTQRQEVAAKLAAGQKTEREWLVKQKSLINAYELNIKRAQVELEALFAENSKPTRKNGKPIARAKWSSEAEQRYERASADIKRLRSSRDERITEFNARFAKYAGPWPEGEPQLTPIPVSDMP